jgi:REP element-mobilizing transposase RayT
MSSGADWTSAWTGAAALLLVTTSRDGRLLGDARSRRLLELALAVAACRENLHVHAHVVLPSSLHVIGGVPSAMPWPRVLGQVKSAHARWDARRRGIPSSGALRWRANVLVRPLAAIDIAAAIDALHALPVREGLVRTPGDWDASSWHRRRW